MLKKFTFPLLILLWFAPLLGLQASPMTERGGDEIPTHEDMDGTDQRANSNPMHEVALAKLSLDIASQVSEQLFSTSGQLVETIDWYASGEHGLEIDANGMPPGVYFLQVQTGVQQEQTNFIVLE